jgi:CelD/BcsL family acetyltransferase involved in cellulose biosynthesis
MVDATASFGIEPSAQGRASARQDARATQAEISTATPEALSSYARLCANGVFAPAQSALWVENWVRQIRPDSLIATITSNEQAVFALALEVVKVGPFRVARFMGGTHANGNFAPALPKWLRSASEADIIGLTQAIGKARPDIDALMLQRVATDLDGIANPLLPLPHAPTPNIALSVNLDGGFDAVLERTSAKRKRKKHRAQTRKFEAAGGYRRLIAQTSDETQRLFDAFLAMKVERFRKMGIANVFEEPELQAFFHALFAESVKTDQPIFTLEALEVGGVLRAVTGTSQCGKRLICEFGAISDDELAATSPGEFLFYDNINAACADGFGIYDFSVGDEPYKRLWCDIETRHVDIVLPLTAKGRMFAASTRATARLKAFVKNSPFVWKIAKALRKRAAGGTATPAED